MKTGVRVPAAFLALCLLLPIAVSGAEGERKGSNPQDPTKMQVRPETNMVPGGTKVAEGGNAAPITDPLELLPERTPRALATRTARFTGVTVQQVLNPQYLLVGPDDKRTVVVRLQELNPKLKRGDVIDVSGIIAQLGDNLALWQIDPEMKQKVAEKQVFVNAVEVKSHATQADSMETINQSPPCVAPSE